MNFAVLFMTVFAGLSHADMGAYDIILIAGQSNAVGYGLGKFSLDHSVDSKLFQVGRIGADNLNIIAADQSLQFWDLTSEDWPRAGLGLSFIREYAKGLPLGRKVLVIPAAKGGTSILEWQPNGVLYQDMAQRVRLALQKPNSKIVAVLWHQGESDILLNMDPDVYLQNLTKVFAQVLKDFPGSYPILTGEPVPTWMSGTKSKQDIVKRIQDLRQTLPQAQFVPATGLQSNQDAGETADPIHFSAKSSLEYGVRYHNVFVGSPAF